MTERTPNSEYDPTLLRDVFETRFTYAAGFERNVHRFAKRPAMTDSITGQTWTYAEMGRDVGHLVGGLREQGVGVGDVVCYQLMNRPEFAMLYLATQGLRAVGSPMNFRLAPGETAYILDDSKPVVFIYETAASADIAKALDIATHKPSVLVAVGEGEPVPGSLVFDVLLDKAAPSFTAPADATVWDETTRLYTSGTTGRPKAVPLSSLNEVLTAHDVIMHMPLSNRDTTMNMSPWFHRGGTYCAGPNTVFYVGASLVTLPVFDPELVLDHVQNHGVTFVIGAPTNLERLADSQEAEARDLSTLTGIVTMGAPFEKQAALRFQRVLTPNISNGYGTTETFWNTFLPGAELTTYAGSAGRGCIDDDVRVVVSREGELPDANHLVPQDGVSQGEIAMRSAKSSYMYMHNEAEQAKKFRDGWFFPGDLATWDDNAIITIVGRKDDMIISGGENVHPVQVEEVLAAHPGVADAVVVGQHDEEWGQLVVAYIVRKPGELTDDQAAATELDAFCKASPDVADFKRPRKYAFVDSVPYTATGKKQHFVLQQQSTADDAAGLFVKP